MLLKIVSRFSAADKSTGARTDNISVSRLIRKILPLSKLKLFFCLFLQLGKFNLLFGRFFFRLAWGLNAKALESLFRETPHTKKGQLISSGLFFSSFAVGNFCLKHKVVQRNKTDTKTTDRELFFCRKWREEDEIRAPFSPSWRIPFGFRS